MLLLVMTARFLLLLLLLLLPQGERRRQHARVEEVVEAEQQGNVGRSGVATRAASTTSSFTAGQRLNCLQLLCKERRLRRLRVHLRQLLKESEGRRR